jgi:hypothetical protein
MHVPPNIEGRATGSDEMYASKATGGSECGIEGVSPEIGTPCRGPVLTRPYTSALLLISARISRPIPKTSSVSWCHSLVASSIMFVALALDTSVTNTPPAYTLWLQIPPLVPCQAFPTVRQEATLGVRQVWYILPQVGWKVHVYVCVGGGGGGTV